MRFLRFLRKSRCSQTQDDTLENFTPELLSSCRIRYQTLLTMYWLCDFIDLPIYAVPAKWLNVVSSKGKTEHSVPQWQSRDLTCTDMRGPQPRKRCGIRRNLRRLKRTIARHAIYFLRQFKASAINSIEFNRGIVFLGLLIWHLSIRDLPRSFRLWLQSLDSLCICDNPLYSVSSARRYIHVLVPEFMTIV